MVLLARARTLDEFRPGNKIINEAAAAAGRDRRRSAGWSTSPGGSPTGARDSSSGRASIGSRSCFRSSSRTGSAPSSSWPTTIPPWRGSRRRWLRRSARRRTGRYRTSRRRSHAGAAARAKRHAGIHYDGVPASLADAAVEPGDLEYGRVRSNYMRGGAPGLVLRPGSTAEVSDALAFARRHPHLPLGVRSGGHGLSGPSTNDGGLVIDLGRLDSIEVLDEETRRIRVGPGARWKRVAAALAPYGGRSAPETTAAWASAAWPRPVASGCSAASRA